MVSSTVKAVKFVCPHCDDTIRVAAEHAGKKGRCPRCKGAICVPGAQEPDGEVEPPRRRARAHAEPATPATKKPARAEKAAGAVAPAVVEAEDKKKQRLCPECAEVILVAAKRCRHCGVILGRTQAPEGGVPGAEGLVLRIWGFGIVGLYGLATLGGLALTVLGATAGALAMIPGVMLTLVCLILVRIGWGLTQHKRSALYGLCFFAALALLGLFVNLSAGQLGPVELVRAVFAFALFAPPIIVGFKVHAQLT